MLWSSSRDDSQRRTRAQRWVRGWGGVLGCCQLDWCWGPPALVSLSDACNRRVPCSKLHTWLALASLVLRAPALDCVHVCHVQVNKDDLLSMVRYGAELVFSSEATNITGEAAA